MKVKNNMIQLTPPYITTIPSQGLTRFNVILIRLGLYFNKFDGGGVVVFNATFSIISAISWRSVLLVEETGVPRENHRPVAIH